MRVVMVRFAAQLSATLLSFPPSSFVVATRHSMSTPFPRSSRRAKTPIRIPCKIPGCRRWFGNNAGLTQHTNRFHPSFLANSSTSSPTSTCPNPAGEDDNEASSGDVSPHAGMEGDAVDSQWHGPGAKLYRNFHSKLTGKLTHSRSSNCLPH